MSAQCYSFKVGNIDCTVLLDGRSLLGIERFLKRFPDEGEAVYRQIYADMGLSLDEADSSLNVLLARIGDQVVLVDAGEAGKPNGGHVLESMELAGIRPEEITLVVITHCHGDHVQGILADNGAPVYPNASYVISREELAFWRQRIDSGSANHGPILSLIESSGLRVIDMDEPILAGLTAVPIPGHTPGQIGLLFESEGEKLLHLADLLHSPMQFVHPEWSASFDLDTQISVPSRRSALQQATEENTLAIFYHLTFPGLGHVQETETGFTWEPLNPST